jgi:hypothetical protein
MRMANFWTHRIRPSLTIIRGQSSSWIFQTTWGAAIVALLWRLRLKILTVVVTFKIISKFYHEESEWTYCQHIANIFRHLSQKFWIVSPFLKFTMNHLRITWIPVLISQIFLI